MYCFVCFLDTKSRTKNKLNFVEVYEGLIWTRVRFSPSPQCLSGKARELQWIVNPWPSGLVGANPTCGTSSMGGRMKTRAWPHPPPAHPQCSSMMYMKHNTIKKIQFGGYNPNDYKDVRQKINRLIMNEIELEEQAIDPDQEVALGNFHIEEDFILIEDEDFGDFDIDATRD